LSAALRKAGFYAQEGDEPVPERARKVSIASGQQLAANMAAAFKFPNNEMVLFGNRVSWRGLKGIRPRRPGSVELTEDWVGDEGVNAILQVAAAERAGTIFVGNSFSKRASTSMLMGPLYEGLAVGKSPVVACFVDTTFWPSTKFETRADGTFRAILDGRHSTLVAHAALATDNPIIIVPMNHHNTHWTVGAIDMEGRKIHHCDSMHSADRAGPILKKLEALTAALHELLQREFDQDGWRIIDHASSIPQQKNGSDCGVFALLFAVALADERRGSYGLKRGMHFDASDIKAVRYWMLETLYLEACAAGSCPHLGLLEPVPAA